MNEFQILFKFTQFCPYFLQPNVQVIFAVTRLLYIRASSARGWSCVSLHMLDYSMSFHSLTTLIFDGEFRWVGWWWIVSPSPRPYSLCFETKDLGLRVWGQGLTIFARKPDDLESSRQEVLKKRTGVEEMKAFLRLYFMFFFILNISVLILVPLGYSWSAARRGMTIRSSKGWQPPRVSGPINEDP